MRFKNILKICVAHLGYFSIACSGDNIQFRIEYPSSVIVPNLAKLLSKNNLHKRSLPLLFRNASSKPQCWIECIMVWQLRGICIREAGHIQISSLVFYVCKVTYPSSLLSTRCCRADSNLFRADATSAMSENDNKEER